MGSTNPASADQHRPGYFDRHDEGRPHPALLHARALLEGPAAVVVLAGFLWLLLLIGLTLSDFSTRNGIVHSWDNRIGSTKILLNTFATKESAPSRISLPPANG